MIENNNLSNGFASDSEETQISPVFDVRARQTARMVIPLQPAVIERTISEASQINPPRKRNTQQISNPAPNPNQFITYQSKPKSFLKYFLTTAFVIFALCAGGVGGYALAQYKIRHEEKELALIPQETFSKTNDFPGDAAFVAFEDPDEISETEAETTGEDPDVDENPPEPKSPASTNNPNPSKQPQQKPPDSQGQPTDEQAPPQEQRERKVRKPNQNANDNRSIQKQPQAAKESIFQKLKKAIEKIGQ